MEQTRHIAGFSTPIFRFKFPEAAQFNQELLEEGCRLRTADEGVSMSNRGGWHSTGNLYAQTAPCIQRLKEMSRTAVIGSTRKMNAKADPDSFGIKLFAWMNANPPGGYNAPHTHPGAHWSGVYYVSQPKVETGSSGKIEFLDPRSDLPNWQMLKILAFDPKISIRPEPGEMILFPSYLVHWVHPNVTEEERVTIAFNAIFQKSN